MLGPPRHSEKRRKNEVRRSDPKNLAAYVRYACGEMLRVCFRKLRSCSRSQHDAAQRTPVRFTGSFPFDKLRVRMSAGGGLRWGRRVILRNGERTKSDDLTRRISRRLSVMHAARCFGSASVDCVHAPVLSMTPPQRAPVRFTGSFPFDKLRVRMSGRAG